MDSRYYKNDNNDILSRYRNLIFDINCKNASVTLGRNNIIEHMGRHEEKGDGKSEYVVIMPYAKSAPMMSLEFWNMLVDELLFRNLKIFTNVGDKREKAIVGTDIINEEIMETAYFCNSAKAVISIRSGMCDVLGLTDSKIIVLNTSEEMSEKWDLSYLWGSKRIKNIDTWDMDDKEIIDVIMKHL